MKMKYDSARSHIGTRKEKISARLMSLSGLLSFVPLLLLLGFGGTMTARGEISVGTFYIFINLSGNVWERSRAASISNFDEAGTGT